ncbi:unnamed protein product, partial [Notodromas monacha]
MVLKISAGGAAIAATGTAAAAAAAVDVAAVVRAAAVLLLLLGLDLGEARAASVLFRLADEADVHIKPAGSSAETSSLTLFSSKSSNKEQQQIQAQQPSPNDSTTPRFVRVKLMQVEVRVEPDQHPANKSTPKNSTPAPNDVDYPQQQLRDPYCVVTLKEPSAVTTSGDKQKPGGGSTKNSLKLVQRGRPMFPEWNSSFDAPIRRGMLIHLLLYDRSPTKNKGSTAASSTAAAVTTAAAAAAATTTTTGNAATNPTDRLVADILIPTHVLADKCRSTATLSLSQQQQQQQQQQQLNDDDFPCSVWVR